MSKNNSKLAGRVALVTGASKGIGRSIARAYAEEGAKVVLFARSKNELKKLADEIQSAGGRALAVPGNVGREGDAKKAVEVALKQFGRIDILVNDAGILGSTNDLDAISEADWDEVMSTNVKGYFLFARAVLPTMRKQKSGNIINISSGAGERHDQLVNVRSILYNLSKFAVEGLTYAGACRLQGTGVNMNAIKPGPIRTAFFDGVSEEEIQRISKAIGEFHQPEFVNGLAIHLGGLAPGELNGASIDASQWYKLHGQ
ncbi:MAG TPA: SDR family oxidoreductase [Nitrososphaerales archaeon]|nr:SDR family oxidoreductase [Nitrososphaerales archaeon]